MVVKQPTVGSTKLRAYEVTSMRKKLLKAFVASLVVAVPLAFCPITIASGDLLEVIKHPYFWTFYAKGLFWLVLTGFAASALTLVFVRSE